MLFLLINFILTSNRDETPLRSTIPPKKYVEDEVELTYPKDTIAGGTWVGDGISGSAFIPGNAGVGLHVLTYSYTDPFSNCSDSESLTVEVFDLPVLSSSEWVGECRGI